MGNKIKKLTDYNMYIDLNGEVESILPELAEVYKSNDGDMSSVEQAIKEHIASVLDDILLDYDSQKLEQVLKKHLR